MIDDAYLVTREMGWNLSRVWDVDLKMLLIEDVYEAM